MEERLTVRIERRFKDQKLGLKLLGGYLTRDDSIYGVFVRDVSDNSAAAESGLLQEGDLLVEVDNEFLGNCRSENIAFAKLNKIFENTGALELVIARGDNFCCEFLNILAISVVEKEELMREETQRLYASQCNKISTSAMFAPHDSRSILPRTGTLDPNSRIRVEKLEVSLQYLGISMTPFQQEKLRDRLSIEADGTVKYGDFVHMVHQVLQEAPPTSQLRSDPKAEKLKTEAEKMRKEIATLKELLHEKEYACNTLEEEVLRMRKECATVVNECRAYRKRAQQSDLAQQQAACMEKDYQQVISIMEAELAEMKRQTETESENPLVQQRLSVLGCQLRKAENGRKIYRAVTDRLLAFTRMVHASLFPESTDFTTKRLTPHQLGEESGVVLEDVRKLLKMDDDELGFAWEEAFTEEGDKYYINHITKKSQWDRPRGAPARPPSPLDTK